MSTQSAPFSFSPHSNLISLAAAHHMPTAVPALPLVMVHDVLSVRRAVAPPTRFGGHLNTETPPSAREWGKRQAARSPRWSDEKWQRIATLFGVCVADERETVDSTGRDAA
ncbi:hypothetical protein Pve01_50030 [Planomonospora venezuelensis]|nr:hypothetical protein Pve01_50030 [Planomonospora venezuelensis]